jgi:hypothetical protein
MGDLGAHGHQFWEITNKTTVYGGWGGAMPRRAYRVSVCLSAAGCLCLRPYGAAETGDSLRLVSGLSQETGGDKITLGSRFHSIC